MNPCQYQTQLTASLLGELPEAESVALLAHLATCPECRATQAQLSATLALLGAALKPADAADQTMRLDATRRQQLLAVRPESAPNGGGNWFVRRPVSLGRVAATVVVGLGLFGIMSSALFPAVSNSPRAARRAQLAMAARENAAAQTVSANGEPETQPTAVCLNESKMPRSFCLQKAERNLGDGARAKGSENGRKDVSQLGVADWSERRSGALGRERATEEKPAASAALKERGYGESLAWNRLMKEPQTMDASGPIASAGATINSFSVGKAPEGRVRLNIAVPKPQFTGTPKDVRSPNLETAADRLAEAADGDAYETAAAEKKNAPAPLGDLFARAKAPARGVGTGGVVDMPAEGAFKREKAKPSAADTEGDGMAVKRFADTMSVANRTSVATFFNPFVAVAAQPSSTFAMDVDTASYTLARQALRSGALPEPERVRTEEIVNAFDYGDTAPEQAVFRVYQDGAQSRFSAGHHLLRIGVKGRRLGREEQRPAMLTFLVDVSGSMSQPDRIGLARLALTLLLDQLAERDRIQIIAYSDHARLAVEPSGASEKARIIAAFERLQCNGSTNLEEGMRQAYEQAVRSFIPGAENRVILISDGVANLGADSAQEILDKVAANRKQGITCSVFGVGAGTYNDRLLEELANKGDGVYRFLDCEQEVRTAFVDDLAATLNSIAKDAKIQVEWNPVAVRQYRQLGYENRALRKEQFRDDSVDAGEVGSGQSVTALYELDLAPDVAPAALLGTVRIRYQRTDSGKVEELEAPLMAETVLRSAHEARAHFRVAASAAEFAELLRGSPYAAGQRFEDVADYLRPAALELSLDTRVKELLELVEAAAAIKR